MEIYNPQNVAPLPKKVMGAVVSYEHNYRIGVLTSTTLSIKIYNRKNTSKQKEDGRILYIKDQIQNIKFLRSVPGGIKITAHVTTKGTYHRIVVSFGTFLEKRKIEFFLEKVRSIKRANATKLAKLLADGRARAAEERVQGRKGSVTLKHFMHDAAAKAVIRKESRR